jgi:phosphatidylglycerophosphatase A
MKKPLQIKAHTIRSVWRNPIHFVTFGFGSGVLPKMPGTWGTVAAIPLYMLIMNFPLWLYGFVTLAVIVFSVIACDITEREIGIHDYPGIVLDEIAGYLLTMFAVPLGWFWIIAGFILFRIFDIWKPWPIGWVDRKVSGGFGTTVDDLLAAVYAWIVLQLMAGVFAYYN